MGPHYHTTVDPRCVCGGPEVGPWWVHNAFVVGPWWVHGASMTPWWIHDGSWTPWFVRGSSMMMPRASHDAVYVLLWLVRGGPMVGLCWYHGAPRWIRGRYIVLSWGFHGESMGWFLHAALVARKSMTNSVHRLF